MARLARAEYGIFHIFHVMVQGNNKEYIFKGNKTKEFYLKCIKYYKEEHNISVYNYVMMGNHAHFLFRAEKIEDLSNFMRIVNTTFAQKYNEKNKHVGHVFRDRFKSVAIENYNQYWESYDYINKNPVKAKIRKRAENYIYSGVGKYAKNSSIVDEQPKKLKFYHDGVNIKEIDFSKFPRYKIPKHREYDFEEPEEVIEDIVKEYFDGNLKDKKRVSIKKSNEIMDKIKYRTCITKKNLKELLKVHHLDLYKLLFAYHPCIKKVVEQVV